MGHRAKHYRPALTAPWTAGDTALQTMALNQLARLEAELAALRADVADAEARVEEWNEAPDVGAQLARYASINEAIGEQLAAADGVAEMNAVLKRAVGRRLHDPERCGDQRLLRVGKR